MLKVKALINKLYERAFCTTLQHRKATALRLLHVVQMRVKYNCDYASAGRLFRKVQHRLRGAATFLQKASA